MTVLFLSKMLATQLDRLDLISDIPVFGYRWKGDCSGII